MTKSRPTRVTRTTHALALAALLAGCEAVPYAVRPEEAALLPSEMAVDFLRSLPAGSSAVALRPENEHCEFRRTGLRVAAANPAYVTRMVELPRAQAGIERERRELGTRMQAVDAAMAREWALLGERLRGIEERERSITSTIKRLQARAHEPAAFERAAFVIYRRFRGDMHLDIEYEVPQSDRVDGCGLQLNPADPGTPQMVQRRCR